MISLPKIKKEIKHLHKTGIPRCMYCKKNWVHDIDLITKKESEYSWKPDCDCLKNKDIRISIG